MEELNYRQLVIKILESHGDNNGGNDTEVQLLFDMERDHYQVLHLGWKQLERIYGCIIHVDIKDGKIWIQRDGTEVGANHELVALGVPKQDIVLAFQSPYKRKFTEFALS